jgi:hypothetical protein
MKIAVLGESPADEAAVSVFIEGIVGDSIQWVSLPKPPMRGWNGVFKHVGLAIRHLHYHTDAEAIVVTLDSDESPVHSPEHVLSGLCDPKCRICQLRTIIENTQTSLRSKQGCAPIKIGLGLAVPAIEAWCLCGTNRHISESAWIQALQSRSFPYSKKELKQQLYGTAVPALPLETQLLVEHARRLVAKDKLALLESCFPIGFGSLANVVRSWIATA